MSFDNESDDDDFDYIIVSYTSYYYNDADRSQI